MSGLPTALKNSGLERWAFQGELVISMEWYIIYMGVSKNRGTPKWMVKIRENPIKMDDLGVPLFLETPIYGWKSMDNRGEMKPL